jgi:hypothetical protein
MLRRFPQSLEPMRIPMLSGSSTDAVPLSARGKAVTITVHPAYSLLFREERNVPEISFISPDDVDNGEAQATVNSLFMHNYAPIKNFIEKREPGKANVLHMPCARSSKQVEITPLF